MIRKCGNMFKFLVLALAVTVSSGGRLGRFPDGRIVGGVTTTIEEFPHQISLEYVYSHRCGGAVLDENTVVTAAHCTDGVSASSLFVRAGSTTSNSGGVRIPVAEIRQHEDYSSFTINNDISILKLSSPLPLGENILPISLPASSQDPPSGTDVVVTGWGVTAEGGGIAEKLLRKVEMQIVGNEECRRRHGSIITPEMVCAGVEEGGKDACQGDSGGPMVSDGVLYGVVSWGRGCGRPYYPGVYSNVARLLPWILANKD